MDIKEVFEEVLEHDKIGYILDARESQEASGHQETLGMPEACDNQEAYRY